MDENSDNQTQTTQVNQTPQNTQAPSAPDVSQPPVQPPKPVQTSFQQPSINQRPAAVQESGGDKPKSGKKIVLIIALVFSILALVAVGIFVMQKYPNSKNQPAEEKQAESNTPVVNQQPVNSDTASPQAECDSFSDMLETCTPYICQFTHPLTGEQLTREIIGTNGDVCVYSEQMPNNGKMDCEYTEEMLIAVAKYVRDLANAETFGTELSADLGPGESEVNTTYTINGKVVDNPVQEALDSGQCVVSGY